MGSLHDKSNEELVTLVSTGGAIHMVGEPLTAEGAAAHAELTRRLIISLAESSTKLARLTWWLIAFTVALVLLGLATLLVTLLA